jgi:hypothetical protein
LLVGSPGDPPVDLSLGHPVAADWRTPASSLVEVAALAPRLAAVSGWFDE